MNINEFCLSMLFKVLSLYTVLSCTLLANVSLKNSFYSSNFSEGFLCLFVFVFVCFMLRGKPQ